MVDALKSFSLAGKIAVVTGGTSGIGRGAADHLASAGADIAIVSRHEDACTRAAEQIAADYGVRAMSAACDVTDPRAVESAVEKVCRELGTPDVLFNNAGININGGALDLAYTDWLRVLDVNVNGVFLMARAVAARMIEARKPGSIVNTASISASIVNLPQQQTAYNTSKAAVLHMTKTLAVEWAPYGIRVNAISPGYVWTEMNQIVPRETAEVWMRATPFHRFATTDEIASAVLYFASDASGYTSGSELIIDGCFTCL